MLLLITAIRTGDVIDNFEFSLCIVETVSSLNASILKTLFYFILSIFSIIIQN